MVDLTSNRPKITLPSPLTSIQELLKSMHYLYAKPEWRTHGSNDPKVNIKLIEAKSSLIRAMDKLQEIVEEI